LVHREIMPAIYTLVRRGRPPSDLDGLSQPARLAYSLMAQQREVTAGDVRRHLGVTRTGTSHDPAYEALAELQRALLVDRGPFEMPAKGVPYLSRDGYPYHLFHQAHADIVKAASRLSLERAADRVLGTYLKTMPDAAARRPVRLLSLFKLFLNKEEIAASLDRLSRAGTI
jgi:hypothetical protein